VAHTSIISIVTVVDARAREITASLHALHAAADAPGSPF